MVAAFLDSWLTGDPEDDECALEFCKPTWPEVASVAGLAARLYLGGAATPRRYFAWGQAVRYAVLAVLLVHAVLGLELLVRTAWSRGLFGLPAPPASLVTAAPGGAWPTVYELVDVAWIVIFVMLALGHYRTARVLAALAIVPGLVLLLKAQLTGIMQAPFGPWACGSCSALSWSWPWPRSTPTPRRPRAGPGCWHCPPATCWCSGRCWRSRRPATPPGCRTFPGCAAFWSPWPAWRTRPGPGPARPPGRACGRWP